jgi:acetyl esterase/lipase
MNRRDNPQHSPERKPLIPIVQQVLISPGLDLVLTDRPTLGEFGFRNGPFVNDLLLHTVVDEYIPNPTDRENELASGVRISRAHAKFQPPTLIVVSAVDPARDFGIITDMFYRKRVWSVRLLGLKARSMIVTF